jgi:hypothetical protein
MTKEALWADIYSRFAALLVESLNTVERLGVTVVRGFTYKQLEMIHGYKVFTLFTHYSKTMDEIELYDGVCKSDHFAIGIDPSFNGTIDLTVCKSTIPRDKVKARVKNAQTFAYREEVPITALTLIYRQVIVNLSKADIHYTDCYLKTIEALNKKK